VIARNSTFTYKGKAVDIPFGFSERSVSRFTYAAATLC
jgi:TolB-like protein